MKQAQPRRGNKPGEKKKALCARQKRPLFLIIAVAAGLVAVAAVFKWTDLAGVISWVFVSPAEVLEGSLPISDGLDDVTSIPAGEVRYRLNQNVTFENAYSAGDIMLENPAAGSYDLRFEIYLVEPHKLLYRSRLLKPGQYVLNDKLNKGFLKAGEYSCVYAVKAFDDKGNTVGEYGGYLTLTVKN